MTDTEEGGSLAIGGALIVGPQKIVDRIHASYNACAGIPTAQLEKGSVAKLITSAHWAERALSPFSKDPQEQSGITNLRAALAPFQKD